MSPTDEVQVRQKCPVCGGNPFMFIPGYGTKIPAQGIASMSARDFSELPICPSCDGGYVTTWVPLWKLLRTPAPVLEDDATK